MSGTSYIRVVEQHIESIRLGEELIDSGFDGGEIPKIEVKILERSRRLRVLLLDVCNCFDCLLLAASAEEDTSITGMKET